MKSDTSNIRFGEIGRAIPPKEIIKIIMETVKLIEF